MNIDEALPGFVAESADLLREMEEGLLRCARGESDADTINLIIRGAHTVKGSAGLFGLDDIVAFVHVVETVLDSMRLKHITVNQDLVTLLLTCKDHIQCLVDRVGTDAAADPALTSRGEELLSRLRGWAIPSQPGDAQDRQEAGISAPAPGPTGEAHSRGWRLSLRFASGVLAAGMDPLSFLRYLRSFCELRQVRVCQENLPALEVFVLVLCYLGFEVELWTAAERSRIVGAFDFVKDDCQLELTEIGTTEQAAAVAIPTGGATEPGDKTKPGASERSALSRSVRVDAGKLDTLITRIGELIIAAAGVSLTARKAHNEQLEEQASTLTTLVEQVREGALQLRMVKIGATFDRFNRVVHDVSRELGKELRLALRGKDTELDKTVVEQIGDPLTHLVRIAIDHGIEHAEVRAMRAKPTTKTITLNAYHDSGNIVIQFKKDSEGLLREMILA